MSSINIFSTRILINEFTKIVCNSKCCCQMNAIALREHFAKKLKPGEGGGRQAGWGSREERQLQPREFTLEEKMCPAPNLAGSMFGCHRSTLFVLFPWHWTKECIVGKPSWHMTQCKGRSQREAASRGWHGLDALRHSTGSAGWVALPTEARVQFAQFSWELPVKPKPCKLGQSGEQRPCPLPGDAQKEAFQRGLVKRRKNYTQILEENRNGF